MGLENENTNTNTIQTENTTTPEPTTQQATEPQSKPSMPNYEELFKTDKSLQSWYDRKVNEAVQNAVRKDREKMKLINDAAADETTKVSMMTPEQQAEYWKQKAERIAKESEAKELGRAAKEKAASIFEQNKIPVSFLDLYDVAAFQDDFVAKLMNVYSQYEFYPKGNFDKAVSKALEEKLAQTPPEQHQEQQKDPYGWKKSEDVVKRNPWEKHINR